MSDDILAQLGAKVIGGATPEPFNELTARLDALSGQKIPAPARQFLTADCETDPFDGITYPEPFIWGLYDGYSDEYREFDTPDEFIDCAAEQDAIIYAHNGGKFDWHFITHRMPDGCEPLIINGRLSKFHIGKAEFRDSFNLISQPLRNFLKDDFNYLKLSKPLRWFYRDEIRAYLKSDCVNLWEVIQQFRERYGLHLTQAGAAMQIWQQDFLDKSKYGGPKMRWRQKRDAYQRLRPYYFGGRVQCFESGIIEGSSISVDINSAYPYAMLSEHPFMKIAKVGAGEPPKHYGPWEQLFFTVRGIARGCFPYKDIRGSTYYPADDIRRTYRVTGWELVAAIETKTIEPGWEILEYIGCETTINFREYINYFWQDRTEQKAIMAASEKESAAYHEANWKQQFDKIFMNSLYGKFGSDIERYKRHFFYSREEFGRLKENGLGPDDDYFQFKEWIVLRTPKDASSEQRYYHVGTAASITGFVRAMLWRAVCAAERPLYCDTDSVKAQAFPLGSIDIGPELGQWEIEEEYDYLAIAGKKMYAGRNRERALDRHGKKIVEQWKSRSKGVRLGADQIVHISQGGFVDYHPEAPSFKLRGDRPEFISRHIELTAADATRVPRHLDPEFRNLPENVT